MRRKFIFSTEQGSDEWKQLRLHSVGGTAIGKITPKGKQRSDLINIFVGEMVTGIPYEGKSFTHAERGIEFEPVARSAYEFRRDVSVEHISIIKLGDYMHVSPDGFVGSDGIIEIKTRLPHIFVGAIKSGHLPKATMQQIQWGLFISDRDWCDYIQFCPEFEEKGFDPLIVERIERDGAMIAEMKRAADEFINDVKQLYEVVKSR